MAWTRAIHLIHWADTQDARHQLPNLLRKLVRVTVSKEHLKTVNFPSGEQVQRSGVDGIVETGQGNQFVPTGTSAWEAGVNKDKKSKADNDFEKRTEKTSEEQQRGESFVFATLRTWEKKDEWAEANKSSSQWNDVIVHDANDLEHWLELAPAVDVWLSTLMGRRPPGVVDVNRHWQALSSIAEYPLQPEVFLTARQSVVDSIVQFLQEPPACLFVKSEGWDDGVDFLAALFKSDQAEEIVEFDRLIVVTDIEAWRHLASSQEPLVLVAGSNLVMSASDVADAVKSGHHVLVTGSEATTQTKEIELPRLEYHELYKALENCGYDEAKAQSYASGSCGSPTVLKRLITKYTDRVFPKWSQGEFRTKLAPFALIGGWSHVDPKPSPTEAQFAIVTPRPLDLWCLEQLGLTRDEVEEAIATWSSGEEPLFVQFANSVLVGSREDAWHLLGGSITPQQLERFRDIATLILDEDNPALKMDPDKRWMANLYGKVPSLSGELRRSVVESLALMTCYPTAKKPAATIEYSQTVRSVLEQILPANASWERWASLGRNLMLLAEADPDFILDSIEADLASSNPELAKLFENSSTGLFGSQLHCALLWTLEELAWSPEYLGRATCVLAQLAQAADGVNSGNNPIGSLQEIFLLWIPHTNATIEDRIAALEAIVDKVPERGWQIVTSLLPTSFGGTWTGTYMPRWRPWADGWTREKAAAQRAKYASCFGDMMLRLGGMDATRWATAVEGMLRFGGEYTEKTIKCLEKIASKAPSTTNEYFELWETLREITFKHSRHQDADWALHKEIIDQLSAIRDSIEPKDEPVLFYHWLFNQRVQLPDIDQLDFEKHDQELEKRRSEGLGRILSTKGVEGIKELLGMVDSAAAVGEILGEHALVSWKDLDIPATLDAEDNSTQVCTLSYCKRRFSTSGWPFVEELPISEWTDEQVAILSLCLRFERKTWDWITGISSEATSIYWKRCRAYLLKPTIADVDYAIENLLAAGRVFAAAEFVKMCSMRDCSLDEDRLLSLLESGLKNHSKEDAEQSDCYALQEFIGQLQESKSVDKGRLARIEWGYLPVLDRFAQVQPSTLFEELRDNPQFYYDLLKLQYLAEGEEPSDDEGAEHEEGLALRANELFEQFDLIPGTQDEGKIDAAKLNDWIDQLRNCATEGKRLGICDSQIGEVLSRCQISKELDENARIVLAAIERIGSENILNGFSLGIRKSRGTTTRLPTSGGDLERVLVERYRTLAKEIQSDFPKMAKIYHGLASHYEEDASIHDVSAQRTRLNR